MADDQQRRADRHRAAQAALAGAAVVPIPGLWARFFDLHDLRGTSQRLVPAIQALVQQYGRAGASAALTQYRNDRRAANAAGTFRPKMPPTPTAQIIEATVAQVLSPLYGKPRQAAVEAATSPGTTPTEAAQAVTDRAVENAEKALESSVEQLILDQSRTAILDAVRDDRAARGWARVTEPGACYFCAMLASRGAVYKTSATASFKAHRRYPNGTGGDCRCHVEPFFDKYEPTAQVRQWMADWNRLKDEHGGSLSLIAWRRAFEGRDGSDRPPLADAG